MDSRFPKHLDPTSASRKENILAVRRFAVCRGAMDLRRWTQFMRVEINEPYAIPKVCHR